MNMKILFVKNGVALLVFFTALVFAGTLYAASIFDIQYPIAELGNCESGQACKAYCDISEHQRACEDFATKFGIGKAAEHKEKVANAIRDGGPGNCAADADDPAKSCRTYCDDDAHIRECVAYGEERGLLEGEELEEAHKVTRALESGARLPDGCTSASSCKEACENPNDVETARQCFAFAQQAGLLPPGVDRNMAEKTLTLIAEGKAPFKSIKDFKQCDNPPSDEVLQKCIGFAVDNGLLPAEEAEMIKKTGGKGPGGCVGKKQCEEYCRNNQDACFAFAEEHDLIRPKEKEQMKKGVEMLKQSYENAPSEVRDCLSGNVEGGNLEQILNGQKMPSREIGEAMRLCFKSAFKGMVDNGGGPRMLGRPLEDGVENGFFERKMDGGINSGMQPQANFPPEVAECIRLSAGTLPEGRPNPAMESAIRKCFTEFGGGQGDDRNSSESGYAPPLPKCQDGEECVFPSNDDFMERRDGNMTPLPYDMHQYQNGYDPRKFPETQQIPMRGGFQGEGVPDGQYPYSYIMPPENGGDRSSGFQNMMPPGGFMMPEGGVIVPSYPPQSEGSYPTQPSTESFGLPPPPSGPTSFFSGIKNIASVIFSLFRAR